MHTDSAFWIGSAHAVCQDYATCQDEAAAGPAGVVLCDGCSSSPNTDIGARLLAHAAKQVGPAEDGPGRAVRDAARCAEALGLPPRCLDATLLTIWAGGDGAFTVTCAGDGVIALGRRGGTVDVFVVEFAASYPLYPSYLLDEARRELWERQAGNTKTVTHWTLTPDGRAEGETRESAAAVEVFQGGIAEHRFAAVLSDGVQSFTEAAATETSRTTVAVPAIEILAALLAFKSGPGQFVQRRTQAFRKDGAKRGRRHSDDLSLAAIWFEE